MFRQRDPLLLRGESADMRDNVPRVQFDLDLVPGLAHLHPPPDPGHRNRVANGVYRYVAFHIHRALMQTIHFRNPRRQSFQMQPLHRVELARDSADVFLVGRIDTVAPLPRLLVQIAPGGERAARKKVVFDEGKRTLHTSRAVGVAALMRYKAESEAFPERLHLGHRNHLAARAAQHHHMRVVDHYAFRSAAHVAQRVGEKHLAIEPLEGGIDLEEQQTRVAQHRRSGLRLVLPAAHLHFVRRRVVLHLLT